MSLELELLLRRSRRRPEGKTPLQVLKRLPRFAAKWVVAPSGRVEAQWNLIVVAKSLCLGHRFHRQPRVPSPPVPGAMKGRDAILRGVPILRGVWARWGGGLKRAMWSLSDKGTGVVETAGPKSGPFDGGHRDYMGPFCCDDSCRCVLCMLRQ